MPVVDTRPPWLVEIEKSFGKGILKPASQIVGVEYRGSGSLALDVALGGGWPKRRVIDVIGKESSGKTLLFELAAIEAQQREGLRSILFDFEGTFEVERFKMLGGDPSMLDIITAENVEDEYTDDGKLKSDRRTLPLLYGEYAVDMAKIILRASDTHACMCFDSTGAMISIAEFETKMEQGQAKQTMTQTARLLSDSLRVLVGSGMLARSANGITAFFISQLRDNVGGRGFHGLPPPDKKTGGRALRFYASVQVEVSKGDRIKADVDNDFGSKDAGVEIGGETKIRVRKQKCNRFQGRVASFEVYQDGDIRGMDRYGELVKLSALVGEVTKSGSWYKFPKDPGRDNVQGPDKFEKMLHEDYEYYLALSERTRNALARQMDSYALPAEELVDENQFVGDDVINGEIVAEVNAD